MINEIINKQHLTKAEKLNTVINNIHKQQDKEQKTKIKKT